MSDEPAQIKPGAADPPMPPGDDGPAAAGTGRRVASWAVLALATLLAIVAIFAVWANRQLLDTDNWTETSTALLENQVIRAETATFLTDELYANVNVEDEIRGVLPDALKSLAAPAAGAARGLVDDVTAKALATPQVQAAWANANRQAHAELVAVIEDKSDVVALRGDQATLDLRPLVVSVGQRVGLSDRVLGVIPQNAGQITVLQSDQLEGAQQAVKALGTLDWLLRVLVVLLFGLAIWLGRGKRAQTLVAAGLGLVIAGLAALLIRSIAGGAIVDELATTEAVRPAAQDAWEIGTSLLSTLAWSAVFVGLPAIVMGLLLGPYGWARDLRARLAPTAAARPEVLYGVAIVVVLILVIWEPVPATRRLLTILVFLAVIVGGTYALRRLALEENPDAGSAAIDGGPPAAPPGPTSAADVADAEPVDRIARLERLVALRDGGALDDVAFEAEKRKLLNDPAADA